MKNETNPSETSRVELNPHEQVLLSMAFYLMYTPLRLAMVEEADEDGPIRQQYATLLADYLEFHRQRKEQPDPFAELRYLATHGLIQLAPGNEIEPEGFCWLPDYANNSANSHT